MDQSFKHYKLFGAYVFQLAMRPLFFLFLKFFVHLEIEGKENIKGKRNFILTANHINEFDGFTIPASIPPTWYWRPFYPVSREKEFYLKMGLRGQILYGGGVFTFMGAFPVHVGHKDFEHSLFNQIKILEHGESLLIFPEGGVKQGHFLPENARAGIAYLLHKSGRPIIPVHISGIEKLTPSALFFRRRTYKVVIGSAIYLEVYFENENQQVTYNQYKNIAKDILKTVYNLNK